MIPGREHPLHRGAQGRRILVPSKRQRPEYGQSVQRRFGMFEM